MSGRVVVPFSQCFGSVGFLQLPDAVMQGEWKPKVISQQEKSVFFYGFSFLMSERKYYLNTSIPKSFKQLLNKDGQELFQFSVIPEEILSWLKGWVAFGFLLGTFRKSQSYRWNVQINQAYGQVGQWILGQSQALDLIIRGSLLRHRRKGRSPAKLWCELEKRQIS